MLVGSAASQPRGRARFARAWESLTSFAPWARGSAAPNSTRRVSAEPTRAARRAPTAAAQRAASPRGREATEAYFLAPEYSSICVVRSIGYEIVTSVIVPSAPVTGVSFGITNPVYDGRFSSVDARHDLIAQLRDRSGRRRSRTASLPPRSRLRT